MVSRQLLSSIRYCIYNIHDIFWTHGVNKIWLDGFYEGVKTSSKMTIRTARRCTKDRREWRALVIHK